MDQFEIEAPLAANLKHRDSIVSPKLCFPCEVCLFCPPIVLKFIPKQWHYFQSWTHVWLVMGSIACAGLTVDSIVSVVRAVRGHKQPDFFFAQEIMTLVFMVPCLYYFIHTVEQYDSDLRSKRKEAQAERQKVMQAYLQTLGDMDNMLKETSETNAGFAERAFETQRRDFIRFLERIQSNFTTKDPESVDRFRVFCQHWFSIFVQCSIDPIREPMVVVSIEELQLCKDTSEVCTLCLERLRFIEVRFITKQMQKDASEIKESRNRFQRLARVGSLLDKSRYTPWALAARVVQGGVYYFRGISWITLGCGRQSVHQDALGEDESYFPKVINFKCGCLVLLSREHLSLLIGFFIGWILALLEILSANTQKKIVALILVADFCLGCILVRFEAVDIIQRLAKEARKLEREKDKVRRKQEEMNTFWNKAQQLTDLWLHRSVPCLDLLHEIQTYVGDMPKRDALECMALVNPKLEELHGKLGTLEAWFQDGDLAHAAKRHFGNAIGDVVGESDLRGILVHLNTFISKVDKILIADASPGKVNLLCPSNSPFAAEGSARFGKELSLIDALSHQDKGASTASTSSSTTPGSCTLSTISTAMSPASKNLKLEDSVKQQGSSARFD